MKYAVLSDIHANLEALQAVLKKCASLAIDRYVCLGDIVGYGADPAACIDAVRELRPLAVVKGNHDEFASNEDNEMEGFNPHAKMAVLWTKNILDDERRSYLAGLPMRNTPRGTSFTVVHATLDSPDTWGYIFDVRHAADNFSYQFTPLCFCGHSHVPLAFCKKPVLMHSGNPIEEIPAWAGNPDLNSPPAPGEESEIVLTLERGFKYLINVGSVGQPRNRDPRASFAVYDSEEKILSRICVPYDITKAQEKIRAAGLPERLAFRLQLGN